MTGSEPSFETVTDGELSVRRVSPRGQVQTWLFQPFWVRLALEDRPGLASRLTLSSHGRSIEIASANRYAIRFQTGLEFGDNFGRNIDSIFNRCFRQQRFLGRLWRV